MALKKMKYLKFLIKQVLLLSKHYDRTYVYMYNDYILNTHIHYVHVHTCMYVHVQEMVSPLNQLYMFCAFIMFKIFGNLFTSNLIIFSSTIRF